jgi:hypothetical protein
LPFQLRPSAFSVGIAIERRFDMQNLEEAVIDCLSNERTPTPQSNPD